MVNLVNTQGSRAGNGNYRVTHINDVVPRLPPAILGYSQPQPNYFIQTGNNVTPGAANIVVSTNAGNPVSNASQSVGAHSWYLNNVAACGGVKETPGLQNLIQKYKNMVTAGKIPAE
jgi:hypothetical protein